MTRGMNYAFPTITQLKRQEFRLHLKLEMPEAQRCDWIMPRKELKLENTWI